ncbi:GNAT family N-acetyltransferase [Anabaena sphaerica FACHB-251]|uniref:GNAT family N-acetyltransferase n=1 Tax=Anabaena sphaerica FACHB-251 TaxID=2692883 RepID=A0A926WIG6_9NOST|nr:GNAT family N-acetyltransferase [Anabaena sphaerica]MBD2294692.1 GNAT family N-acetyltransferase [Anabaena sphaerica FACHB-251]
MKSEFQYTTLSHPEDIKQLGSILNQSFITSPSDEELYINCIGAENFRIIHHNQYIAGGLATLNMGQWWGGKRVPMTGIASVGIAPEYRGDGAALALMQHTIQELYAQEVPISVLYPATQTLYRKVGFEQGGSYCIWEILTDSIQVWEQPLPVQPVMLTDHQIFHDLYQQQAQLIPGYLDRNSALWQLLTQSNDQQKVYAYFIGSQQQPQGYIIFNQERTEDGAILKVIDWVVLTDAAAQTFWSFLFKHRSQIKKVQWKSSVIDSLKLLLPEPIAKISLQKLWMLRVINLFKALEMRGYPAGIQAELHLDIKDDLLPANNGKFILSVVNGCGKVTKGGKGELQLDIRGLAPLYTGLFSPHQLQQLGKLDATESALSAATQIFTSVSPGMANFF